MRDIDEFTRQFFNQPPPRRRRALMPHRSCEKIKRWAVKHIQKFRLRVPRALGLYYVSAIGRAMTIRRRSTAMIYLYHSRVVVRYSRRRLKMLPPEIIVVADRFARYAVGFSSNFDAEAKS